MAAPEKTTRKRTVHLTESQKAEIVSLWEAGEGSLNDLAGKFDKDRSTIINVLKAAGAVKNAKAEETKEKVQSAVEQALVSDVTLLATRIRETKEEHYKMAAGLSKLAWNVIVTAKQNSQPMGNIAGDMKALKAAAEILKITREERYAVLGITEKDEGDDKPMPDLVVQELTAQDIKELHQRALMADDELGDLDAALGDDDLIDAEASVDDENERIEVDA